MGNAYKLVGFINMLDIRPGFVYPVFENEGKYYFQHGVNNTLFRFEEVREDVMDRLIPLKEDPGISITLESNPIYAYQKRNGAVKFRDMVSMRRYVNNGISMNTGRV